MSLTLTAANPTGTEAGLTVARTQNDVTVTVTVIPNPPADPGHSVQKAWKLNVTSGSLTVARVTASAASDSPLFYYGCDPTIPLPDTTGWDDLTTSGPFTARTAILPNLACNPRYAVLAT